MTFQKSFSAYSQAGFSYLGLNMTSLWRPGEQTREDSVFFHNRSQKNRIHCIEQVNGWAQMKSLNGKSSKQLWTILLCHAADCAGDAINQSWGAFVQHSAFWNHAVGRGLTIGVGVSSSPGAGHLAVQEGGWSYTHAVVPARWCNMARGPEDEENGNILQGACWILIEPVNVLRPKQKLTGM